MLDGVRLTVGRLSRGVLTLAALLGGPTAATAQDMAVPVDLQLTVLTRALSYDRSLPQRAESTLVLGVLYQPAVRASVRAKDDAVAWVHRHGHAVSEQVDLRCVPIALADTTDIGAAIRRHRVDVLYVAPMRAVNLTRITQVSRAADVLTVTGVVSYVRSGIAFGIDEQDRRTRILINLPATHEEGSDFSSQLLAVSLVIDGDDD